METSVWCEEIAKQFAVRFGSLGFEHKIKKIYAGKKIYTKNLLKQVAGALSAGKEWPDASSHKEELELLHESETLQLPGMTERKAIKAGLADDWLELMRSGELNPGGWRS